LHVFRGKQWNWATLSSSTSASGNFDSSDQEMVDSLPGHSEPPPLKMKSGAITIDAKSADQGDHVAIKISGSEDDDIDADIVFAQAQSSSRSVSASSVPNLSPVPAAPSSSSSHPFDSAAFESFVNKAMLSLALKESRDSAKTHDVLVSDMQKRAATEGFKCLDNEGRSHCGYYAVMDALLRDRSGGDDLSKALLASVAGESVTDSNRESMMYKVSHPPFASHRYPLTHLTLRLSLFDLTLSSLN
jgi:hypothetical protein